MSGDPLDIGVYGARGIPSTYSGYETFLTELLPRLAARGHRVTMYCRRGEVPGEGEYRSVLLRHLPAISTKSLSTPSHGMVAALAARLARHDVVLVVNVANTLAAAIGTRTGQPVVLNTDGQEWLRGKWGPAGRRVFKASAARAARWATAVVSDCQAMADVYRSEFGAPATTVIPYMYLPGTPPDAALVRQHYGLEPGGYFVAGGRLVPENNVERIAHAYSRSGAQVPLLVLGRANYASPVVDALRALAAADARVRLVDHVSDRSLYLSLLSGARRYIHGHSVGGINPSLVEAMGSEAAIAALDTPFNREALGPTGELFGGFDTELVRLIEGAAGEDPDGADPLRRAASRRALELFSPDAVVDAYERLLAAAAAARSTGRVTVPTKWRSCEVTALP